MDFGGEWTFTLRESGTARFPVHRGRAAPQAATTTESNAQPAIGSPGRIPLGNPPEPPNSYSNTGNLAEPEPMPYLPAGGNGTSPKDIPVYQALSDFDWHSLSLALYQEYIELDLFQEGLRRFTVEDFQNAGLTENDRSLIEFMAEQEVGHATLISNILGPQAPRQCEYQYPFETVPEFIDFCQKLTRWGESGVYGFLPHLDSRPAAQLLLQSITTEARQQMIFRQFEGLFPMTVWFEGCGPKTPRLPWQNFPALFIQNNPNGTDPKYGPAITHNRPALSEAGREVHFLYEGPGQTVGPNGSYITNTTAGPPKFAAWFNQLNVTYTPLYDIADNTAKAVQPAGDLFSPLNPIVNGTVFVALMDTDLYVTPANVSLVLPHVVALALKPALRQPGRQ
ncbi:ferritin-like domain-containing protein [Trichophaea hybrida]|nr:ferritin-like domain-containing protein [Trichophaea hybrida]